MRNIDYWDSKEQAKKLGVLYMHKNIRTRIINKIHNLMNNKKVVKKLGTKIKGFKTGIYRV